MYVALHVEKLQPDLPPHLLQAEQTLLQQPLLVYHVLQSAHILVTLLWPCSSL